MSAARIAIVDYDMGNLRSVEKAFAHVGAEATITRDTKVIADATHVVLPGVGAFSACMKNLEEYGLIDSLVKATKSGKPFLGICLGLQLLFEESSEQGTHKGLGIIPGKVVRFKDHQTAPVQTNAEQLDTTLVSKLKVPHMGWNDIEIKQDSQLLSGVQNGSYFYFVHSYYVVPTLDEAVALTTTKYGVTFVSSVAIGNVTACQFHPEKSQTVGLRVLKNFKDMN